MITIRNWIKLFTKHQEKDWLEVFMQLDKAKKRKKKIKLLRPL